MWSKSLKVVEGIAALGGAIELVKLVVQAWQSVAFGPGSPMPREYELLAAEFGSPWGLSFYRYYPSNTKIGHEFWVKTYQIWQKSKDALAELSDKPERVGEISTRIGAIEADLNELFDSMNDTMRNMVCDYLGDDGLEEEGDHSDESGEGGRMTMM